MPAVTVLMPAFNAARHLRAALDSIIAQSFGDFELLVIDDGSTDETAAIIQGHGDPRIRYVRNERNLRLAATLNRGLDLAAAPLIARMDADDIAHPDRLAWQVRFLAGNPEVALVGTGVIRIHASGRPLATVIPELDPDLMRWRQNFSNQVIHPTVMFRADALRRLDLRYGAVPTWVRGAEGLGEVSHLSEDYLLFGLLALKAPVVNLPDPLLRYRVHSESVSNAKAADQLITAQRVSRLLLQQVIDETIAPDVASLIYFTRPISAPSALIAAAIQVLNQAADAHVERFRPPSASAARIRRDAAMRARVLLAGRRGALRRIGAYLGDPVLPRDAEETRLVTRMLASEQSIARVKGWRASLHDRLAAGRR